MEFLIDRQGYLRARWIPGEGPAAGAISRRLRDEIQSLTDEIAATPPDEHVH